MFFGADGAPHNIVRNAIGNVVYQASLTMFVLENSVSLQRLSAHSLPYAPYALSRYVLVKNGYNRLTYGSIPQVALTLLSVTIVRLGTSLLIAIMCQVGLKVVEVIEER